MQWIRLAVTLVLVAPSAGLAQSGSVAGNGVAAQDTAQPVPKKKGGLFGKMKGLTKSKLVNTVAKTALCTAVPGGSMVAAALEAKKAKHATSAAANLASGSSGSCMPGIGLADKAGAAAGVSGAVPGVALPGLPTTGLETAALSAAPVNPTGAMPGAMSPAQLKQMEDQYRKMGMKPDQIKAMEAQMQSMQQAASMPAASPEPSPTPVAAASNQPGLSTESGKLVVRGLPWMPATAIIRPDAQASFRLAMRDLASAVQRSGTHYKVSARVEEQGKKAVNRKLSHQRAAAVVAGLIAEGILAGKLKVVDGDGDKDARILLQETK